MREAQKHHNATASGNLQRRSALRKRLRELETQAKWLYSALAEGTVGNTDLFRGTVTSIESEREQSIHLLSRLDLIV